MVEAIESLKSELQLLKPSVKPTREVKFTNYTEQVESLALAIITFAHMVAVTFSL